MPEPDQNRSDACNHKQFLFWPSCHNVPEEGQYRPISSAQAQWSRNTRYPSILWNQTYQHYGDVIMRTVASQITSFSVVCSTVFTGTHQTKHLSSASLAFVRGIHRWPVNSPHKGPVTRKMFPFDDVIIIYVNSNRSSRKISIFKRPLAILRQGFTVDHHFYPIPVNLFLKNTDLSNCYKYSIFSVLIMQPCAVAVCK